MAENKPGKKVGRPAGPPVKILHFRVPAERAEFIKAEILKLILRLK